MLLRALNKQSRTFMDRLIDELKTRFKAIRVMSIQPNIKMEGAKMREDRDARQNRALRAYSRLMKIEDFQGMVQLSLGIQISDYKRGTDFLDTLSVQSLLNILTNPDSTYDQVTITFDTDHNHKGQPPTQEDEIVQFLH